MSTQLNSLGDAVSAALDRVRSIETLVSAWEERLRMCEIRKSTAGTPESTVSSSHGVPAMFPPGSLPLIPTLMQQVIPARMKCAVKSCSLEALIDKRFCRRHMSRACQYPNCTKTRLGAHFCIRHGGGKRCQVEGCNKGASGTVGGGARFCIAHGGGRRCKIEGCNSTAKKGGVCSSHGGRYECIVPGCRKTAHGPSKLCVSHGGGSRASSDLSWIPPPRPPFVGLANR